MNEPDVNQPMRLSWRHSCRIACLAMLHNCTFEQMITKMLQAKLQGVNI